jgi:hypothetical protein
MHLLPLLGLLLVSAYPAEAHAQDAQPDWSDTVRLTFDWPQDLQARVDLQRVRVQSTPEGADSTGVALSYEMDVSEHPDGLAIRYSNYRPAGADLISNDEQHILQLASSVVPGYIVTSEGALLEVADLEGVLAEWRGLVLDGDLEPAFTGILEEMMSEQVLVALATQEWNALVGAWAGGELVVGAAYETEAEEPAAMLGNVMIPFRYEVGASARVPCTDGDLDKACIELIMRSSPDQDALRPHLDEFAQRLLDAAGSGVAMPQMRYRELRIDNEVVLIARPGSMVPHRLSIFRSVGAVIDVDGVVATSGVDQLSQYSFTYADPAPRQ